MSFKGMHINACEPGSSVGIATGYGLDGLGIEFRWGARFSAPVQTDPGAHPASCTMGTGSFPGVKGGRGVTLTPHPFQCHGQERVELYLYFPHGPYGLYRATVPVQGCSLSFYIKAWNNTERTSGFRILHYALLVACLPVSEILIICLTSVYSTFLNGSITMCSQRNIILYSVRQHNHFIT